TPPLRSNVGWRVGHVETPYPVHLRLGIGHRQSARTAEDRKHFFVRESEGTQHTAGDQPGAPDSNAAMDGDTQATAQVGNNPINQRSCGVRRGGNAAIPDREGDERYATRTA